MEWLQVGLELLAEDEQSDSLHAHVIAGVRLERQDLVALHQAGYEASRMQSPFNRRLYARRNLPGEQLVVAGPTRLPKTTRGIGRRDLSPSEVRDVLTDEIGLSRALVAEWVRSGGLEASFEPPLDPKPAPVAGTPPSRR